MSHSEPLHTHTVVIGAGIAGSWLAYRLTQLGVDVILISAQDEDTPNVSRLAAMVFDRGLIEATRSGDPSAVLADETATRHPRLGSLLRAHLTTELAELERLVPLQVAGPILIPQHPSPFPRLGAGDHAITLLHKHITTAGGRILEGRVTDLLVTQSSCHGVAYVGAHGPAVIQATAVVLATGGHSGLLPHSHTSNSAAMLGVFAAAGGELTNLEFSQRHALGDLTAGRILYPPDLDGATLYRGDDRADWLTDASATFDDRRRDLDIFQRYWRFNGHVPHTYARGEERHLLGPIYGLSMGGVEHTDGATTIEGVYVTGEARHDLASDAILGRPWAIALAGSGRLAQLLKDLPPNPDHPLYVPSARNAASDRGLRTSIRRRLYEFEDHRFSARAAMEFIDWCRDTRRVIPATHSSDTGLLILAESYALSALARRESRGFFFRADHPQPDPELNGLRTRTTFDAENDIVTVELTPNHLGDQA
ncbi:FAD-dependent oxidoreductase [Nocardia yamanashiensis]|uniref:FAD-dependent oxidoreductase n=1 Tax=Nocardia yamanashiensis TaxID=209247 RepID=UPI00082D801F|nr:FAD-dependent oxidoreductase [Nocardia yamanashiensis]